MEHVGYENLIRLLRSPWAFAVSGGLILIMLAVPLIRYLRKTSDARRMKRVIRKCGRAVEQDVVLSDGIDGYLFVDYLILLSGKIIAVKVAPNSGYIFGGEKIDEWTCVENNRTGKFKNPLEEVNFFVQQARRVLGFDAMEAYALFGSTSEFPKGLPQGVLRMASLEEELAALNSDENGHEAARQAWDALIAMAHEDRRKLDAALES